MELTCRPLTEASEDVVCSSNPVQTFSAGPTCKLLTKNAIFQSPDEDGSIFVCAGDEASNSALVRLVPFCVVEGFIAILRREAVSVTASVCFGGNCLVTRMTLCGLVCGTCCSRCSFLIAWDTRYYPRPVVHIHQKECRQRAPVVHPRNAGGHTGTAGHRKWCVTDLVG